MTAKYFAPEFRVEVDGHSLAADLTKNITDVSVTMARDGIDTMRLALANPYPALRWTHTSDGDLFFAGTALRVWMGYAGELAVIFDGEVTGMTPSFPASGPPTLRVEASNRLHRLQQKFDLISLRDATDGEMVCRIAAASGLGAEVDDPGTPYAQLSTDRRAHLEYLLERARAVGREVWVEGKTLHFSAPRDDAEPAYTLVWGRTRESDAPGSLPLQSFNPTLDVRRQLTTVIVRGQHPLTREVIEGRAGVEAGSPGGGETGAGMRAAMGGPAEMVVVCEPVASRAEAEARARALYAERAMELIQGSGDTLGIPGLRPGKVVTLDGLGRFNGRYYVTQATHSMGGGGYQTNFSVQKDSIG
ncbi:MAG TPA: hypothetical protein VFQ45_07265 [Longimicrobium sp.]|nr:hypothetical protein [Longimicrobium sp.]